MEIEQESSSSGERFKLYDQLELLEFQDKFVIKPPQSLDRGFSISRHDGTINLIDDGANLEGSLRTFTIYGVVGTIRLLVGTYVLVITSRKEVGSFLGFPVYRLMSMRLLACNEALRFSTAQEKKDEAYFRTLLNIVESMPGLYYSYDTDITLNLQRRCKLVEGWMSKPIWKQADPRFVWNKHLLEDLIEYKVRGSIPLLWEQIVDLSYKPHLRIISHEQTPDVVQHHFRDLFQRYGDTLALDLTDKIGDEGQLSAAYAAEMQNLQNVRYVSFDFHHHCGSANFDNLDVLYDQISEDFERQRYFLIDGKGNILEEQRGIERSNCIDCLDRTNVTQCYLGQKSLNQQLQRIGIFSSSDCISMFGEEYVKFRSMWAEQGDEISLEYAGTHALKGDLVRYGKQTMGGMIKDGMSALSRYYQNNFHDGIRQDALDLISGRYTVSRNNPSPFQLNGFESISYLPVASALLLGGLTITTITVQQAGRNMQHYLSSILFAGVTAGVMAIIKANGRQFCSRPRLCGLL